MAPTSTQPPETQQNSASTPVADLTRDGEPRQKPVVWRLFASTTFLLGALLVGANFALSNIDVGRFVPMNEMTPQEAAQRAVAYKMETWASLPRTPDVMLVGSSLPMSAAYYADAKHAAKNIDRFIAFSENEKLNPFQAYPAAEYFSRLLSQHYHRRTSVFNLTAPACMISDARFLMHEAFSVRKPEMVIWGIAPRDFVDNVIPPIGKTPAFAAVPDWKYLSQTLPTFKSFDAGADSAFSAIVPFYNERSVLKHIASATAASLFRPAVASAPEAAAPKVEKKVEETQKKVAMLQSAPQTKGLYKLAADPTAHEPGWNQTLVAQYVDYFHRYNPPNYELLDAQCAQLERALADCKRDGIRVVLVDMPLPRRHQTLIDAKLHASYRTKIAAIAAAHGATLLDLNHPDNYNADDWIDSLHVTASGADKFLPELVSSLPE